MVTNPTGAKHPLATKRVRPLSVVLHFVGFKRLSAQADYFTGRELVGEGATGVAVMVMVESVDNRRAVIRSGWLTARFRPIARSRLAVILAIAGISIRYALTYADHKLPHDAEARELTSGRSRIEVMRSILGKCSVIPMQDVADGINAARIVFSRCWFDSTKCKAGIEALRNYRKQWDDKKKCFHDKPLHDWASHGADAWRQFGVDYRELRPSPDRERYRNQNGRRRSAWAA